MNFNYTEEQIAVQDSLKRFILKNYDFDQRMKYSHSELGYSEEAWQTYAELGLLALPFPVEYDGLDGTPVDTMMVMDLLGKGLCLEPYLSTVVICGGMIRDFASHEQKLEWLPKIGAGSVKLSLAHYEPGVRYETSEVSTKAIQANQTWLITGKKSVVLHGNSAEYFIVSARTSGNNSDENGISLFMVHAKASGVKVTPYELQDGGKAADVELVNVSVDQIIGLEGQGITAIVDALDSANAALCAEAGGLMNALNEMTVEYLKTRKQFGVPIGKFQALQHRMTDMIISSEQSKSMIIKAAIAQSTSDKRERHVNTAAAKAYICKSARHIGQEAIQLHGGIGVSNELKVGHYFKRLTMISLTFGDYDACLDVVSNDLLLD
jgi:alkylation response protein AidB-like acyl-CoA dehydrogenase